MSLKKLSAIIPIILLPLALWLGYRAFGDYSRAEIMDSLASIPTGNFTLALVFVAASYLCLTGFDSLAIRYSGERLAYPKIALTSFISLSIGHNIGVAAMSSGALRYRLYSGFGFSAVTVAKIIVFCGVTVALGLMTLGGIALLFGPEIAFGEVGLTPGLARGIGALCLALTGLYVILAWRVQHPLSLRGHELNLPSPRLAAAQIAVGTANFAFVAAALHQLLAGAASLPKTVSAYILGNVAGIVSHVPGGLGVLEYVISSLMPHGEAIGALIAFRALYYFLPLLIGGTLLLGTEMHRWRADRTA